MIYLNPKTVAEAFATALPSQKLQQAIKVADYNSGVLGNTIYYPSDKKCYIVNLGRNLLYVFSRTHSHVCQGEIRYRYRTSMSASGVSNSEWWILRAWNFDPDRPLLEQFFLEYFDKHGNFCIYETSPSHNNQIFHTLIKTILERCTPYTQCFMYIQYGRLFVASSFDEYNKFQLLLENETSLSLDQFSTWPFAAANPRVYDFCDPAFDPHILLEIIANILITLSTELTAFLT